MATLRPCFLVALALSSLPLGSQAAQGPWRAPRPRPVSEIQGVPIVPTYSVIQMDTLDGNSSAYDLDPAFDPARPTRRPVVVGGSVELGAGERAVGFREEGTVLDLGVFAISRALGVNSSGTIVGQAGTRAFRFARGAWALLPDLGGTGSVAEAVSEDGIAVGHDRGTGGGIRALYWTADGQGHVLPTGFGSSGLVDVNRRNVAAGTVFGSGGAPRFAFTMPLGGDGRRSCLRPSPAPRAASRWPSTTAETSSAPRPATVPSSPCCGRAAWPCPSRSCPTRAPVAGEPATSTTTASSWATRTGARRSSGSRAPSTT